MGTVIISILATLLVLGLFFYLGLKYAAEILRKAIDVCCYVHTYKYSSSEWDRVEVGQKKFYKALYGEKIGKYRKEKTDYIFWALYTRVLKPLLDVVPTEINQHNNRVLSEGEEVRCSEFVNNYNKTQENLYKEYKCHCDNCKCEEKNEIAEEMIEKAEEIIVEFNKD